MKTICFEATKSGLDVTGSEDSHLVKRIDKKTLMVVVSDGASTGVFSRAWSHHLTGSFDTAWVKSEKDFLYGLEVMRGTFKPDMKRPTALRKFLMEGSYATLFTLMIESSGGLFTGGRLTLSSYSVGDITLFSFTPRGELEFSYPWERHTDFTNSPDLVRSSEKHQAQSPFKLRIRTHTTSAKNTIVVATDALSEFILRNMIEKKGHEIIRSILACPGPEEFRALIERYRTEKGMKNDDVTVCIVTNSVKKRE